MPEAVRLIAGFDDVAMMGEAIEQGGGELGVMNTLDHSANTRLVVMTTLVCSYSLESRWNSSAPPACENGR